MSSFENVLLIAFDFCHCVFMFMNDKSFLYIQFRIFTLYYVYHRYFLMISFFFSLLLVLCLILM